jgi:ribosomal protein S18 acetylase RimI-like enzyme
MTDEAGLGTAGTGRADPAPGRLRLLRATGSATFGDPAWGPGSPPAADVTSLVIDLTDELGREPRAPERQVCRPVVARELTRIAAIHADQLPDGFFVRFGPRFLARYLGTFVAGPYATALSVGPPGSPSGFVVGTVDNPRHYRWLVRNGGPLARSGFVALIGRPGLAYQLVRTRGRRYARSVLRQLRRRSGTRGGTPRTERPGGPVPEVTPVVAVLTHVAVAPDAQGTGLGRVLVEAFVAHARARGADEVRLITHAHTRAPGFYRRLGWASLGERSASDGSLVEEFRLVL